MPYWEITPHESDEFDYCVMPAETETDHRAALEYAQARLEQLWDSTAWEGSPKKVSVTIEIKKEPMPDFDSEA